VRAAAAAVGEAPGQKGVLAELETFDDRQTFRGAKTRPRFGGSKIRPDKSYF
jgi:hypothetical protein